MEPTEIDIAAYALLAAKKAEEDARLARLACEETLIGLIGAKDEGSQSVKTCWYKVTTTGSLTRSLDDHYGIILDSLAPEVFNAIIKFKPSIDVRALKAIAASNPDAYKIACRAIHAKPAKVAVKVEAIEQQQQEAA